jgi:hypothetical protein
MPPITPDKLASAAACGRIWAKTLLTGDSELQAAGFLKTYKDRIPDNGAYPCVRYLLTVLGDVYAQERGSGAYKETRAQLLVAVHSNKADDDRLLATGYARVRQIFELRAPITNDFGTVKLCTYNSDWTPPIASLGNTGAEVSAEGIWFDLVIQRKRLA